MLYAACFENHYQSDDPDDPNYSEIYRYLSQILAGEEPTQLRQGSAAKVLEMIDKLKAMVDSPEASKHRELLAKNQISYLNPDVPLPSQIGAEQGNEKIEDFNSANLFEDLDELQTMVLSPDDPYYEVKKERFIEKQFKTNINIAQNIVGVPGLNPFELPPEALLKHRTSSSKSNKAKMIKSWTRFKKIGLGHVDDGVAGNASTSAMNESCRDVHVQDDSMTVESPEDNVMYMN